MKWRTKTRAAAALILAAVLWGGMALSPQARAQGTNLAAGLPAGIPESLIAQDAHTAAHKLQDQVALLKYRGQYEEALRRCLAFQKQFKGDKEFDRILSTWVELAKKYPRAMAELVEIRNRETRDCLEGKGYWGLFREVSSINKILQQEARTYELFNELREKDSGLAHQCYSLVEAMLVARGEYEWCFEHMGEPQDQLNSFRRDLEAELNHIEFIKRAEELIKHSGRTNGPRILRPEGAAAARTSAENKFVAQTSRLIEILVATGHETEAENIQAGALKIRNDARLKSAVTDAVIRVGKRSQAQSP